MHNYCTRAKKNISGRSPLAYPLHQLRPEANPERPNIVVIAIDS